MHIKTFENTDCIHYDIASRLSELCVSREDMDWGSYNSYFWKNDIIYIINLLMFMFFCFFFIAIFPLEPATTASNITTTTTEDVGIRKNPFAWYNCLFKKRIPGIHHYDI